MYKQYKKDLNLRSLSPLVLVKDIIYTGNTNVYMVSCESRHFLKKKRWGGGGVILIIMSQNRHTMQQFRNSVLCVKNFQLTHGNIGLFNIQLICRKQIFLMILILKLFTVNQESQLHEIKNNPNGMVSYSVYKLCIRQKR